ncbi:ERG2/sigma1 receptor-like protein [Biscogniauxia sp. FL1348]|nr:ERG2/sigma1 receptor-like protein [Biscogniauxia sp. FL1348]
MEPSQSPKRSLGRWLTIIGVIIGTLMPIVSIIDQKLESFYIFEPSELHDLAKRSIGTHGNDTRAMVNDIVSELHAKYPDNINLDEEWIFNNAGGAMGAMYIIHASLTEYLIIFGTAVGTEGHSGRYAANNYFHILTGEQWAYTPGNFTPEIYPPGSMNLLARGTVKQYKMPEGCFALEYCRGWIPLMLFFGFADGLVSTLDFPTLWRTTFVTGREMVGNILVGKL